MDDVKVILKRKPQKSMETNVSPNEGPVSLFCSYKDSERWEGAGIISDFRTTIPFVIVVFSKSSKYGEVQSGSPNFNSSWTSRYLMASRLFDNMRRIVMLKTHKIKSCSQKSVAQQNFCRFLESQDFWEWSLCCWLFCSGKWDLCTFFETFTPPAETTLRRPWSSASCSSHE